MKMRFPVCLIPAVLWMSHTAFAQLQIGTDFRSIRLDNQKTVQNGSTMTIRAHEMIAVSIEAFFRNHSGAPSYIEFVRDRIPSYVEGWVDQTDRGGPIVLPAGRDTVLTSLIYIRPQAAIANVDSLKLWALHTIGPRSQDPGYNQRFLLYLRVIEPEKKPPVILPEPAFSPGLENIVRWLPSPDSYDQNVYYFDTLDRSNLKRALSQSQ